MRRVASSTSQSQIAECAEFGVSTKTTVSASDQTAEAPFPFLATRNAFAVDETLEAAKIERRSELISEVEVVATVRNKDAKFSFVG